MRKIAPLAALTLAACATDPEPTGWVRWVAPEQLTSWDDYDEQLERAAGEAPAEATSVALWTTDDEGREVPARAILPEIVAVPDEEGARRSMPVDLEGAVPGSLSGKAVYLSQCHGWLYSEVLGRFATQRGNLFGTVEDFHNPEGANQYLTAYLENAGAAVFTTRERDHNTDSAFVDDGDPGYAEAGAGFADGLAGWAAAPTYAYGTNPFDAGGTRTFPADGGGSATWTPTVPADGWYAVYVSWDAHSAHATDAHYRITHPGGTIDRWFDQTRHGSTWQYVERLWLPAGTGGLSIALLGDSSDTGALLSADAVRIGGGMGDITRMGGTTGQPRWEEGAVLYTQSNGAPTSVYDPYSDGDGSDPSSRPRWADWEHPLGEDAVYLSWHSNAGGGRGTSTYFAGGGADAPGSHPSMCSTAAVEGSFTLADAVQSELVSSFRTIWDPTWTDRGVKTACFSEVSPSHNDEMPAALVELAFHDSALDVDYLKHPEFRRDASRAMYRALTRYFAERDGLTAAFLPEPPVDVALRNTAGGLELTWAPGLIGAPWGDSPSGYRVQTSADGRSWGAGTAVSGTTHTLAAAAGELVFARVVATNPGGASFPSEVVGARRAASGSAPVLVVAAFDRNDRGLLIDHNPHSSIGWIDRMDLRRMNAYDIAVAHGTALDAAGFAFDGASDEAASALALSDYAAVVWAAGEESTADETFSSAQQAQVDAYVTAGGALWASGAEILWDLDAQGTAADRAFASGVLGATMQADAASTTAVDGAGALSGTGPLDFGDSPYPVEWPDVLATGNEVLALYGGDPTQVAAAWDGQVALFGFPFDSVRDDAVRAEVASIVLTELAAELGLSVGPVVAGGTATFTATGATPGQTIAFARGSGLGLGPCLPELDGRCVGVLDPVFLGTSVANGGGTAVLVLPVPAAAAGQLFVQAAGVGPRLSAVVQAMVE